MGALSIWHWLIVLAVVLLLFGSKKLPDAARGLGRSMRIFKSEIKEMQNDDKPLGDAPQALPPVTPPNAAQPNVAQPNAAQFVQPQAPQQPQAQPQGYPQAPQQPYQQPQQHTDPTAPYNGGAGSTQGQ
ncbi:Sec-independent protein translocase subunit TatA [Dietzia sp. UBA5065]|mgnify:CR=1 FL=1|jgi:sec-independent protein translocase protein TatA|uniref:Sec-independent protein translocase subunit TatA n=1 Tax=Dietzia sp. UBA5065 TaxID=1946422 RepID=UPI0025C6CAA2|nr:Sec-independent protein translocase subunit TatA [Dietzia sp. UBA5065]HMT50049.1 Sec-independent protein translocase subunit TatA [Dietzia sp.]